MEWARNVAGTGALPAELRSQRGIGGHEGVDEPQRGHLFLALVRDEPIQARIVEAAADRRGKRGAEPELHAGTRGRIATGGIEPPLAIKFMFPRPAASAPSSIGCRNNPNRWLAVGDALFVRVPRWESRSSAAEVSLYGREFVKPALRLHGAFRSRRMTGARQSCANPRDVREVDLTSASRHGRSPRASRPSTSATTGRRSATESIT